MNEEERTRKIGTYLVLDRIVDGPLWVGHTASRQGSSENATIWMLRPDLELATARTNQLVKQLSRLTGLNRPGLISVTAIGATTSGPYVVTGDARGETLDQYLTQFPEGLDPSEAVRIVLSVAAVLDEAHRRSLIAHGALDPSKILLSDRTPRVVVRELGLLEAVRLSGIVSSERIASTIVRCRAPEIDRSADRIEPATDQYALAAIAFEMLTGQSSWKSESASDAAPKLVASYRADVPAEVDFVLLRARSHSPAERYAGITEFAVAFRRAVLANNLTPASHASLWPKGATHAPPPLTRRSSRPPVSTPPERVLLDSRVDDVEAVASHRTQPPASRKTTPAERPAQRERPESSRPAASAALAVTRDERATRPFVTDDVASDETSGPETKNAAVADAPAKPSAPPPAETTKASERPAQTPAADASASPTEPAVESVPSPAHTSSVSDAPVSGPPPAEEAVTSPTRVSDRPAVAVEAATAAPRGRPTMPLVLGAVGMSAVIGMLFVASRSNAPTRSETSPSSAATEHSTARPAPASIPAAVVPLVYAADASAAAVPSVANEADAATPPAVTAPQRPVMRLWEPTVEERASAQQHIEVGINICGLQFGQHGRHARVAVTYDGSTGTVENVQLAGYFQHVRIGSCIVDAVRAVHVAPFNRRHWTTTYVLAVP